VIPGNGDQADVNGHHVTVADARTIGRSGVAGTIDVRVLGGGSLTVQNGGTLRCRGDLSVNGGVYRVEGGGTHLFDSTTAAAPTTTVREIRWDSEGAGTRVEFIGTSDALRAVCDSDVTGGAARGRMNGQTGLWVMHLTMQWTRLRNLQATDAINSSGFAARRFHMIDSIAEATCGRISVGGGSHTDVLIERSIVEPGADRFGVFCGANRDAGKQIVVRDSTIGPEFWTDVGALQVQRVAFLGEVFSTEDTQFCSVWEDVTLLRLAESGGGGMTMLEVPNGGVLGRTFLYHPSTTASNPHYIGRRSGISARSITVRGWIVESASPLSRAGDVFFAPTGAGQEAIYEQCITLPNPVGEPPGCLVNKNSGAGVVRIRHCTLIGYDTLSGLYLDESGPSAAGSAPEVEDTILWAPSPVAASLVWREPSSTATSGIGSGWGHNAFWNILNVSSPENPKLGYNGGAAGALVTGTLSGLTTDLNSVNPGFVDSARNLVKFGRDVGGYTGTDAFVRAAMINALRARPNASDAAYNAAVSIPALLDWIAAGFAPTNVALDSASDGLAGGWRGAVEGITPGVQLNPDGTVSNTNWSAVGAASLHAALAAGDADYITASAAGAVSEVSLTNPSPLLDLTDASFTIRARLA
jgi:hypothetical protein